jgi:Leucine-rich repeat (LRR) protein
MLFGEIPSTLMNLTKLTFLGLASNKLQGLIPSSIFQLNNLEVLDVYDNHLSGTMELCMFLNLKSLGMLDLSANNCPYSLMKHVPMPLYQSSMG